jgi:hypothetical protein
MRIGHFLALGIVFLVVVSVFVSSSYAVDKNNIVGAWLFDEGSGKVTMDASGNQHDGEIQGSKIEWTTNGKFGNALRFFGVPVDPNVPNDPKDFDSVVSIPHKDSLNLTTWSITAWIKATKTVYPGILNKDNGDFQRNYALWLDDSAGGMTAQFTSGGRMAFQNASGGAVFDDTWHHIAATYDMTALRAYVDGVLVGELAASGTPDVNTDNIIIGNETPKYNYAVPFNGILDDIGLFDVGLTDSEVNEIMTLGLAKNFDLAASVSASGNLATTWGHLKVQ